MLVEGLAELYVKYAKRRHDRYPFYNKAQASALRAKRGLWANSQQVSPWTWRAEQRKKSKRKKK
jgi:endonuclease YncB( thermonuclease family)